MKNSTIKFSVIMPAYNVQNYISESICSVLKQTYENFELIIINDGSTDKTQFVIDYYNKLDKRVRYLNQNNAGPAAARNAGMDAATGDYIVFLDSDDFLDEEALEIISKNIISNKHPDIVVIGGKCYPNEKKEENEWIENSITTRDIIYEKFEPRLLFKEKGAKPFIWQSCLKLSFLNKNNLRINEKLILGEDQAFQFAYFPKAEKVVFISDKLYNYRVSREDSLMAGFNKAPLIKFKEHIKQVNEISTIWIKNGYMDKYLIDYANWVIDFLMAPILSLENCKAKNDLAKESLDIVEKLNLPSIYLLNQNSIRFLNEIKTLSHFNKRYAFELDSLNKELEKINKEIEDFKNCESYKIGKFFYFGH